MGQERSVITAPRPDRVWGGIVGQAVTPEAHACVVAAEVFDGAKARITAYEQLRAARQYAPLNRLQISAAYVAELAVVVNGGTAGTPASRLDPAAHMFLLRTGLIAAAASSRYSAADRRAVLASTIAGIGVVRSAQGHMPRLSIAEALPLSVIERDMAGLNGGTPIWPGSDLTLRMAQVWALVEYVRGPGGRAVYRLSPAGTHQLSRTREQTGGAKIGRKDIELLAEVDRCVGGDLGELTIPRKRAVARAIDAGWIAPTGTLPCGRTGLRVTKGGRTAAEQFLEPAPKPKVPNLRLTELVSGMWVRLARRKGTDIGPEWVRVVEVRSPSSSTLPQNFEVWVATDGRPDGFLYGGRTLFHSTRFEPRQK